jgi:hypothetical protein
MRRRDLLRLAGIVPAATLTGWLAACEAAPHPPTADVVEYGTGPRDLLVVRAGDGLALVDASLGRVVAGPRPGANAVNGYAFATSAPGARTAVEVTRSTGRPLFRSEVDGQLQARVVSADGRLVALADPATTTGYAPTGRLGTTVVVVDQQGEQRRFPLMGCLEPEAFSTGGDRLFLLDYLPPDAPDRYRVRVLNLGTGAVDPLLTRDKAVIPSGAEEEMRGEGRSAVYVQRSQFLFTLYTHQPDHEHTRDLIAGRGAEVHAFVHSLNLEIGFAYCIDLPAPFGEGPPEGHVIAVAPDRDDPVVVDTTTGSVAELNGFELTVRGLAAIPADDRTGPAAAVLNGLLFLGRGDRVRALRPEGYGLVHEWRLDAPVRGLGLSVNRDRLWVGQPDGAVAFEVSTGERVASVPVPGLSTVEFVGARS